ncbi:ABC transporter permease [Kibdelosporangium phytohabitans]|uniref:ABC transporter n=1 Tax=Kibdelosporangium phytohabitans TaxID=860235 RepID=A0A0N7F340_9PSEU|nr:ABC transporter permease [Kibdelosporangium phytohabitans]ALG07567.1 ABC transporter [Kibdelosporangium phytohabitans]MBE1471497.1 ABC-2 type transport system permease protein [Kibdelosporangium phytohabitans]
MSTGYLVLEIKRALRAGKFLVFTVALPILMFVFLSNLGEGDVNAKAGLMVGMITWGVFSAALFAGARVAIERDAGWQRQLRLTPLSGGGYLVGKCVVGMVVALPAVVLVPLVGGFAEGITLGAAQWAQVTAGVWLGAIPFALLGLLLGQYGTADSMQSITGVLMMVLAMFGGLWVPLSALPGLFSAIAKVLPTYWMSQIGATALGSSENVLTCVLVLAAWAVVLGALVVRRYRVDSARR